MVVAGDINSYTQPCIAQLEGLTNVRNYCFAATLTALGFKDTFSGRHAEKVAFTYISKSSGSRLDQIWIKPAAVTCLEVLKAKIIWKWPYATDHTPVLADILSTVPVIIENTKMKNKPQWRLLLRKEDDPTTENEIYEHVQRHIEQQK